MKVAAKGKRQTIDQKVRAIDRDAEREALDAGKLQPRTLKLHLREVRKALGQCVNVKVIASAAHRIQDLCVKGMYGLAAEGACLLPVISADMQGKGYFSKVHYASKSEMVQLTVDSLQYAHNASHRQLKSEGSGRGEV